MNWFDFEGKKVVILGLARQGLALARYFTRNGAHVVVSDAAPAQRLQPELEALKDLPVELVSGRPSILVARRVRSALPERRCSTSTGYRADRP